MHAIYSFKFYYCIVRTESPSTVFVQTVQAKSQIFSEDEEHMLGEGRF